MKDKLLKLKRMYVIYGLIISIILFTISLSQVAFSQNNTNNIINLLDINPLDRKYYAIVINEKEKILFKTKKEAIETLKKLKEKYSSETTKELPFYEKVEVKKIFRNALDVKRTMTTEKAYEYILKGSKEEKKYIVKKGDTLWSISKKYDLKVNELIKANHSINPEILKVDQSLSLIVRKPLINVMTKEKINLKEKIAFKTIYKESHELYKGEFKIQTRGIKGIKDVNLYINRKNGDEVSRKIISSKIIKEPKNKILLKGSKIIEKSKNLSRLFNPISRGKLTNGYGWRIDPVTKRKSFHPAVDIAAPRGDSIYAAEKGRVLYAGFKGTYVDILPACSYHHKR